MNPARSILMASVAVVVLFAAHPEALGEQYPRGLMSVAPTVRPGLSCRIQTYPLAFPTINMLEEVGGVVATSRVQYECDRNNGGRGGTGARVPVGSGIRIEMAQGASNSFMTRSMYGLGLGSLNYNIYLDPTFTTIWGDGSGPTQAYINSEPPLGRTVTVLVYGRVEGRQDVPGGYYADSVPVRIIF